MPLGIRVPIQLRRALHGVLVLFLCFCGAAHASLYQYASDLGVVQGVLALSNFQVPPDKQQPADNDKAELHSVQVHTWAKLMWADANAQRVHLKGFFFLHDLSEPAQMFGLWSQPDYARRWLPTLWAYVGHNFHKPLPVKVLGAHAKEAPQRPINFEGDFDIPRLSNEACMTVTVSASVGPPSSPAQVMEVCLPLAPQLQRCPPEPLAVSWAEDVALDDVGTRNPGRAGKGVASLPSSQPPVQRHRRRHRARALLDQQTGSGSGGGSGGGSDSNDDVKVWIVLLPWRSKDNNPKRYHGSMRLLWLHVQHHIEQGFAGYLQYASHHYTHIMAQSPPVVNLVKRGIMRLVRWDLPWMTSFGYPGYDQALVYNHALLATSHCDPSTCGGVTTALAFIDVDEYWYPKVPDLQLPELWKRCIMPTDGKLNGKVISSINLQRHNIMSSQVVNAGEYPALWSMMAQPCKLLAPDMLAVTGGSGGGSVASPYACHPIRLYDRIDPKGFVWYLRKNIELPSPGVLGYFVHEGIMREGYTKTVLNETCGLLLHTVRLYKQRGSEKVEDYVPLDLRHV